MKKFKDFKKKIIVTLLLIGLTTGFSFSRISSSFTINHKVLNNASPNTCISYLSEEAIAIIKNTDKAPIDQDENNELWIKYPDGSEELLVLSKYDDDVTKKIAGINTPLFSPDKTKIYFMSGAWATSEAIHVVDMETKQEKYLCPGNSLMVILTGTYKGKLIVNQHRYKKDPFIGSYDHYYLLDEQGKEIKDLGEILEEGLISRLSE